MPQVKLNSAPAVEARFSRKGGAGLSLSRVVELKTAHAAGGHFVAGNLPTGLFQFAQ